MEVIVLKINLFICLIAFIINNNNKIEMEIDGVSKNFMENISLHKEYFIEKNPTVSLDGSLKSIEGLDSIFNNTNCKKDILEDSSLFYGLLAYCGQVIINEVGEGTWALDSLDQNTSNPRYYPYIKHKNKEYEFYGDIERFLESDETNLSYKIKQIITPININVSTVTDWFFPPLRYREKK